MFTKSVGISSQSASETRCLVPLLASSIEVLSFSLTKLIQLRGDRSSNLYISAQGTPPGMKSGAIAPESGLPQATSLLSSLPQSPHHHLRNNFTPVDSITSPGPFLLC
ncbi:hypothetical protein [Laspinema olomoucense]|uniref:hypothetical protein n=1 Tax=Laspinema olomoucense TaxID=3231600 RepID=UPI0021BB20DE|nr:hypothetical protein [Laspinema sp. D3a]MCT7988825.1 hypothetical protein [Laspinema sp. D3a]